MALNNEQVCLHCGARYPQEAKFCALCGNSLSSNAPTPQISNSNSMNTTPITSQNIQQLPLHSPEIDLGQDILSKFISIPNKINLTARIQQQFINDIKPLNLFISNGVLKNQVISGYNLPNDFIFIEKPFPKEALSTIAVRIAPQGNNLFIEWRQFVRGKRKMGPKAIWLMILITIVTFYFGLFLLLIKSFRNWMYNLDNKNLKPEYYPLLQEFVGTIRTVLVNACLKSGISQSELQNGI